MAVSLDAIPDEAWSSAAASFARGRAARPTLHDSRCVCCDEPLRSRQPGRRFCDDKCRRVYFNNGGAAAQPSKPKPARASSELDDAKRQIAEQAATILNLQRAITAATKRAELAEEAVRRAYAFAAARI